DLPRDVRQRELRPPGALPGADGARGLQGLSGTQRALLAGYPDVFGDRVFRRLFLILLTAGSAQGMVTSSASVWAASTFGLGPQGVAMLYVVSGIVGAIGNPLIGLLSDRIGRRRPFVIGQLVVCSLALLGYTQAHSYELALFLVAFSGFGVMGLSLTSVADAARARGDLPPTTV